jgi:hypothetical protein
LFAAEDEFLYWVDGGSIFRVARRSGARPEELAREPGSLREFLVAGKSIYWIEEGEAPGAVMSLAVSAHGTGKE